MALQFTQEEIEEGLAGTLGKVTRADIARMCGLSESYIKHQFNPNDETASAPFRTLQIQCALDELSEKTGAEFWAKFTAYRELSKKRKIGYCPDNPFECLSKKLKLDGEIGAEMADALKNGHLSKREIVLLQEQIDSLRALCGVFDEMLGAEIEKL